jgi:hypothetical protein
MPFDWMTKRLVYVNNVGVSTAHAAPREHTSLFKFHNDALRASLCNTYHVGYVAQAKIRLIGETDEHV